MTHKDNNKKSVFSRILSSIKNLFVLLFGFGKQKEQIFDDSIILSPRKVALNNFKRNRLAMSGLALFIVMTLTIAIGSSVVPIAFTFDFNINFLAVKSSLFINLFAFFQTSGAVFLFKTSSIPKNLLSSK